MLFFSLAVSQCDVLSDPANGEVSLTGLTISSQAIYLCDAGFIIQGSRIRVCQLDGEWSGIEPTCARKNWFVCQFESCHVLISKK